MHLIHLMHIIHTIYMIHTIHIIHVIHVIQLHHNNHQVKHKSFHIDSYACNVLDSLYMHVVPFSDVEVILPINLISTWILKYLTPILMNT